MKNGVAWEDPPPICNNCPFVERMSAKRFVCLRFERTMGKARKICPDVKTARRVAGMFQVYEDLGLIKNGKLG
jgi:hypothetical protein